METVRKAMRATGRLLVFLLLAVLCTARWLHPTEITRVYQVAYEHLRQTLMMQRIVLLPQSRDVLAVLSRSPSSSRLSCG